MLSNTLETLLLYAKCLAEIILTYLILIIAGSQSKNVCREIERYLSFNQHNLPCP